MSCPVSFLRLSAEKAEKARQKQAAFPQASPKMAKSSKQHRHADTEEEAAEKAEKAAEVAAENAKKAAEAFVLPCQLSPPHRGES